MEVGDRGRCREAVWETTRGRGRVPELISAPHVWTAPHRRPSAAAACCWRGSRQPRNKKKLNINFLTIFPTAYRNKYRRWSARRLKHILRFYCCKHRPRKELCIQKKNKLNNVLSHLKLSRFDHFKYTIMLANFILLVFYQRDKSAFGDTVNL